MTEFNIVPADPEEYYGKQIREQFCDAYHAGLIDCIPEVTCNFNSATGDLNVHVNFPPKKTNSIQVNFTFDGENDAIDSPLDKP